MTSLEQYFQQFRDQIIGIDQDFVTPFGQKKRGPWVGLLVMTVLVRTRRPSAGDLEQLGGWPPQGTGWPP